MADERRSPCPDGNGSGLVLVHHPNYWYPEKDECLTGNVPEDE